MEEEFKLKYSKKEIEIMLGAFDLREEQILYVFYDLNYGADDERTKQYLELCQLENKRQKEIFNELQEQNPV
jgi:hypothetical protein